MQGKTTWKWKRMKKINMLAVEIVTGEMAWKSNGRKLNINKNYKSWRTSRISVARLITNKSLGGWGGYLKIGETI
jgi:hypothetical protein